MDLSKLAALVTRHEGSRQFPYKDSRGFLTIGVGHNLDAKGLTLHQIQVILMDDLTDTINFLNRNLPWFKDLDDVRQRALADLTFDLMGKVLDFKLMLGHLKAKEWSQAADELLNSRFAKQTGQRAKDLASMIRTGIDL